MGYRFELVPILLLTILTFNSCSDRRPVWSLSETVVIDLQLDASVTIRKGPVEDSVEQSCRAVMSLRLPGDSPLSAHPADELRSMLQGTEGIRFECIGTCGDTNLCKAQHRVESPDAQWATTGCICDPQAVPPCQLTVQWAVGESSRRQIDRIACGENAEAGSCRVLFARHGRDLQIACKSST